MPIDEDHAALDDSDRAVMSIVSAGLQKASEEAVSKHGEEFLKLILSPLVAGALAGPLAAGAAAMLGVLMKRIHKETSATERKLDRLLAEPFKTATRTVADVLSEDVLNDAEEAEVTRRLQRAADKLEEAYSHAEEELPKKRLLVRLYQSLVAALLEGGGGAMRRNLAELRTLVDAGREEAKQSTAAADRVKNREQGVVAEQIELWGKLSRLNASPLRSEMVFPLGLPSQENLQMFLEAQEGGHRARAASMLKRAVDLEKLCVLIESVHENRREILRATKEKKTFVKKVFGRLLGGR